MDNLIENKIDGHKLMHHPERVREWLETGDCAPITVEVGLTDRCNHNCVYCGLDYARKGCTTLDTNVFLKNLEDMAQLGVKGICYSGCGEQLLVKEFPLIVRMTKELGIDVSFSTNGVLFNGKVAEATLPYTTWMKFSVDAIKPETHSKLHRTSEKDLPKILENIGRAAEIKRKNSYEATIGVQCLLFEENAEEALELGKKVRDLGADNFQVKGYSKNPHSINDKKVNYSKFETLEKELKSEFSDKFLVYRVVRMGRVASKQDYDCCNGLPFFTVLNEKGNVEPCIYHYDDSHFSYGNIYENSFSEIWRSKQRQEVIKSIQKEGVEGCKKGCRLDMINKSLWDITKGKISIEEFLSSGGKIPSHVNFI